MASSPYSQLPSSATLKPTPFTAHVSDEKLKHMLDLLRLSPIAPAVFENTSQDQGQLGMSAQDRTYGTRRDWLSNAKTHWLDCFSWRAQEDTINSFPQFTVPLVDDEGTSFDIHFMALFSSNPAAIPIAFYHGWPGSFLEFTKIFALLKSRYNAAELPFHVIAPSLPGYGYSSGPPADVDYNVERAAAVLNKLMMGLFPGTGYLSQGGDIGSFVARLQAAKYDACKGMHQNMCTVAREQMDMSKPMDQAEKAALARGEAFAKTGSAYMQMHGTRTATIGLVLSSSPLAMLAWIGEKFLEWTDEDPTLDDILTSVSLYWLTDTFPRCIYPYRSIIRAAVERPFVSKPSGFSYFPKEIFPTPRSWAESTMNLVSYSQHTSGGHFAAMEKPAELLADVEAWAKKVWKDEAKL